MPPLQLPPSSLPSECSNHQNNQPRANAPNALKSTFRTKSYRPQKLTNSPLEYEDLVVKFKHFIALCAAEETRQVDVSKNSKHAAITQAFDTVFAKSCTQRRVDGLEMSRDELLQRILRLSDQNFQLNLLNLKYHTDGSFRYILRGQRFNQEVILRCTVYTDIVDETEDENDGEMSTASSSAFHGVRKIVRLVQESASLRDKVAGQVTASNSRRAHKFPTEEQLSKEILKLPEEVGHLLLCDETGDADTRSKIRKAQRTSNVLAAAEGVIGEAQKSMMGSGSVDKDNKAESTNVTGELKKDINVIVPVYDLYEVIKVTLVCQPAPIFRRPFKRYLPMELRDASGTLYADGAAILPLYDSKINKQRAFGLLDKDAKVRAVVLRDKACAFYGPKAYTILGSVPLHKRDDSVYERNNLHFFPWFRVRDFMGRLPYRPIYVWDGETFAPFLRATNEKGVNLGKFKSILISDMEKKCDFGFIRSVPNGWETTVAPGVDPGMMICLAVALGDMVGVL